MNGSMIYKRRILINVFGMLIWAALGAIVVLWHPEITGIWRGIAVGFAATSFLRTLWRLINNALEWKSYMDMPPSVRAALLRIERSQSGYVR